ncbi:MAG: hypothetical protein PHH54_02760 [Candidatus Nanoarchaeia archaeon]|nr:hypothetical protein [Candidatus Nanoarchaeia archaeon]MDD5740881.1 hypothetical protein [Candidatus Nanoarchaeia archaeon]
MAKSKKNLVGAWAFLIGIVLAIALGLFSDYLNSSYQQILLIILVVLGIIVGLLNISIKESSKFLLTSLVLILAAYIGQNVTLIIPQIGRILGALLVLIVPATAIVALKAIFDVAKD